MTDGGSQQGATLYDAPASAPVGRCSAWTHCLYFGNIASSVRWFLLTIYFHFKSLYNASKLCQSSVPMSSIDVIVINNNNNNNINNSHNDNDNNSK